MNTKIKTPNFLPDGGLEPRWAAESSILGSSFVRRSEQLNSGLLPTINELCEKNSNNTALIIATAKRKHNNW